MSQQNQKPGAGHSISGGTSTGVDNTADQPPCPAPLDDRDRRRVASLPRSELTDFQLDQFNGQLRTVLPSNSFYRDKLGVVDLEVNSLDQLSRLPFTLKSELLGEPDAKFAANLTWNADRYTRFHRTSGTRGRPMVVLDTSSDWRWWIAGWHDVLDAANVTSGDRAVMAFSFGPFIGFWSAFDAAIDRGLMVAPTGAMNTLARLDLIRDIDATVVFCTPSYALHMAEIAAQHAIDIARSTVNKIIVAGEPGGSITSIKQNIETAWGAEVIDHVGASEIGPWGFADPDRQGIIVNEAMFLPEVVSINDQSVIPATKFPKRSRSVEPGQESVLGELVITSLGRYGSPVIRYRTGDLVRPMIDDRSACSFLYLDGGVLGRVDDMLIIRGVNIFPSSVEQIIRELNDVVEYRMTAFKSGEMDQLKIEIESSAALPAKTCQKLAQLLQLRLGLRVDVVHAADQSLPRFEAKGKRFVDNRNS